MSVNSVSVNDPGYNNQIASNSSSYWNSRLVEHGAGRLTKIESTRLFTRFLALIAGLAAATSIALNSLTVVALPLTLTAVGLIWYNLRMESYDNPEELGQFRSQATQMKLGDILKTYGWVEMLSWGILTPEGFAEKYREHCKNKSLNEVIAFFEKATDQIAQCPSAKYKYLVPHPIESKGLWRKETAEMSFDQIVSSYSIEKLQKYGLVEPGELRSLIELKKEFQKIRTDYESQKADVEREFAEATSTERAECDKAIRAVNANYDQHQAVIELKGLGTEYNTKRQKSQNKQNQKKVAALEIFNHGVSDLTQQGKTPIHKLKEEQKTRHENLQGEFQQAVLEAESCCNAEVDAIENWRREQLKMLKEQVQIEEEKRNRVNAVLEENFKRSVPIQLRDKEEKLKGIDSDLAYFSELCNRRRIAYLRMVRVMK